MATAKFWREAATLMLAARPKHHALFEAASTVEGVKKQDAAFRKSETHASRFSEDYKVLMVRRSASSAFMPTKSVFPGGVLQKVDHSKGWVDLFQKITRESLDDFSGMFHTSNLRPPIISDLRSWDVIADVAFRICAIRETFEECGLLLATRKLPELTSKADFSKECISWEKTMVTDMEQGLLRSWRSRVCENSTEFLRMCHELEAFPNVWALENWRNWLTPVFENVAPSSKRQNRFDTLFYVCCFDCDSLPLGTTDDRETDLLEWMSPTEHLDHLSDVKEKRLMAPPQLYELERMKLFPNLNQLNHYARAHGHEVMLRWMPVMKMCTDAFIILLPGDHLYPAEPDYDGTKDVKSNEPVVPIAQLMAKDEKKNLHRVIFKDETFRNGRVIRTIASSLQ